MIAPKRLGVSGKYVDLGELTIDDIHIEDIERSLNYIYRFTGHWKDKPPLTVAQHTWLTVKIAQDMFPQEPEVAFDCLLHDMPEAYYGDIATPLKRVLKDGYKNFANYVDDLVYTKLWVIDCDFTPEIESKRKICDLLALDIERRNMWLNTAGKKFWPEIPNERFYSKEERTNMFDEVQNTKFVPLMLMYNTMKG